MRLHSLNRLVSVALALSECSKLLVLGSSSIFASFPELDSEGGPLDTTYDADLLLEPIDKETAAILSESIGSNSLHHTKNGFYADILHPSITDPFPPGWKDRLVPLKGFSNVWALEPHDLAMVKLCVGREKDLELVRALLDLKKLDCAKLRERFAQLPLGERELFRAGRNLISVCPSC